MSELAMNNMTGMYDEVMEIQKLNKVEGFDPRRYMRIIPKEGQGGKYYLDVVYRKLWFRLKYPEGKIVKKLLKLTDQMAIVEAKVYLSRNDAEDSFISNAMAQKYMTGDDQFGNKFVELAETAAVGRALADAGFGLQFADTEGEFDPEVTDAPFDANLLPGGMPMPEGTYMDEGLLNPAGGISTDISGSVADDEIPGQFEMESYLPQGDAPIIPNVGIPMPQQMMPQQTTPQQTKPQQAVSQPAMPQQTKSQQPAPQQATPNQAATRQRTAQSVAPQQGISPQVPTGNPNMQPKTPAMQQPAPSIDRKQPVEKIYPMLTREIAASVVIPMGFNKGKTLGQVALEKPASLEWYINSYGGPDNLLRAAARFLMDAALGQAS